MKNIITIVLFLLVHVSAFCVEDGIYGSKPLFARKKPTDTSIQADSIMRIVIPNAARYHRLLSSYEAEVYIKGRAEILKQNYLIRFGNKLFPLDRRNKDMIFEMVSHSRYDAPNNYFHAIEAVNGNSIPNIKKQQEFLDFLNINVYAPTAYNDGFIMPISRKAWRYYTYNLEEVLYEEGLKIYRIRFLPKQWSQKLITGDLYIVDGTWTIDKIDLSGRLPFADFNFIMSFDRDFRRFVLPESADLFIRYHVLGNAVVSSYHADFNFNSVEWIEEDHTKRKRSLDLSQYFRLTSDTIPIITDSVYWEHKRMTPLTFEEEKIYENRSEVLKSTPDTTNAGQFLEVTEKLTSTMSFRNKTSLLRYSGILNPFQFGYSKRNGITYRQRIRYNKIFSNEQQLRFRPEVGFVFKHKEFFFKVPIEWDYLPERLGYLQLTIGNDNNNYSSKIIKDINDMLKDNPMLKDSINFEDLNIRYFRHYYVELKNNIEIQNGLQVSAGLAYHRRMAVKNKNNLDDQTEEDITDQINDKYNDFTPMLGISYTPHQYYRMDGRRKQYVYSEYPTFSIDFARGIPGVWGSTGNYVQLEVDIHQSVNIGLLRRVNYRVSGGMFIRDKSIFFADFKYFRRRYFPETWDDHIGGVFNLLKGEWYNSSNKYLQAHFMYQSPFMVTQLLKRKTSKHIFSERFYYSQLYLPVLPSYSEIGYGIGNHLFNIAIFASFKKLEYESFGFKFAFELF